MVGLKITQGHFAKTRVYRIAFLLCNCVIANRQNPWQRVNDELLVHTVVKTIRAFYGRKNYVYRICIFIIRVKGGGWARI
jgi:hypothetical protein